MDIKTGKKLLWAVIFSIFFMVFLHSRVEWEDFSLIAKRLDMGYLAATCAVYLLANFIRALRFCKLDHMNNGTVHWWNINAFYNVITSTLPGGAGEAASAYVLKRFSKLNLLSAFRILLLSRLMDLFALSALFFAAAVLISRDTPYREAAIWFAGGLFLLSAVALLSSGEQLVLKLIRKIPGENKVLQKMSDKLSELLKITEEQRNSKHFGITVFQSVLMMIGSVLAIYLALRSFGVDFTLSQIFYCYGVYAIFQIVPIQGIAGIGTQAAWWSLALNAAGYRANDAIAMGFILYGTFYAFVILMGLVSLLFWDSSSV